MNKIAIPILFFTAILSIGATEYWLHPERFVYNQGERVIINFKAGENFMGMPWDLKKNQLEALSLQTHSKSYALIDSVIERDKENLGFTVRETGTYLLTIQTKNALVESDAEKFNSFLKDYGLDEVSDHRKKTNTLSSPGKEYYSCYAKLLFQVGERKDDTHKKANALPVEILPLENPYSLKLGDPIHFKILFDGKPVFGVRVKVWNRFDNRTTIQNIYTEKDGTLETRVSSPGPWMVSVVKMNPSKQPGADWQSYRASLAFGIEK